MTVGSWLDGLRARLTRRPSQRPGRHSALRRPTTDSGLEKLEERTLLAAAVLFGGGQIRVLSDAGDDILVREDPNSAGFLDVQIDGVSSGALPSLMTDQITSLRIETGAGSNDVDISGVTSTAFPNITSILIDTGDGDDTIVGSPDFANLVLAGDGDDVVTGGNLADTLNGNDGNDVVSGGPGDDALDGGDGNDSVTGDAGDDNIIGGDGLDTLDGATGDDFLNGGDGADDISGSDGNDRIIGGGGGDVISGGLGVDVVFAGGGHDLVSGGDDNDTIKGNGGHDTLLGDLGDDDLAGDGGNDDIDGGDGNDLANGGAGNDQISGRDGEDSLHGGGGDDILIGGGSHDLVRGNSGDDTLLGGGGADDMDGGNGNDLLQAVGSLVSITDATVTEGDMGTVDAQLTISLAQASPNPITINFATVAGTASATDFIASNGSVTFTPGVTSLTITVMAVGDTTVEGTEDFFVDLSTSQSLLIDDGRAVVTILDDDVMVSINDVTGTETNGNVAYTFMVSLNAASPVMVSVDFSAADGTATSGSDFQATAGTINFAPGVTVMPLTITVIGDTVAEDDENFFVNLQPPTNGTLLDGQGIGVIMTDDGPLPSGAPLNFDRIAQAEQSRWMTTATDGTPGFGQGDAATLTWAIVPDGTPVQSISGGTSPSNLIARLDQIYGDNSNDPDLTTHIWFPLFQMVFDRYEEISGLRYMYEPNDDSAAAPGSPGVLGVRADVRIGGNTIDGNGGILAFNNFPDIGDMVIDTADDTYLDMSNNSRFFRNVVAHEHGHGIGQLHVTGSLALMNPFASTAFDGPQEIDILSTQRVYGDTFEVGVGNDTALDATGLGTVDPMTTATVSEVSVDDDSDIDFYAFTVGPNDLTINVQLDPVGSTSLVGPQLPFGNTPGTTFNALTLSDLSLDLFDTSGAAVLASSTVGGFGQSESIDGFQLPIAGTYFVRVTGSENTSQLYSLAVSTVQPVVTISASLDMVSDTLVGGPGRDTIIAADSDDLLVGGGDPDIIEGAGGNDTIYGGGASDTLFGQDGDDRLIGNGGRDRLEGGAGEDILEWNGVGSGRDTLIGNDGADLVRITAGNANDAFVIGQNMEGNLRITSGTATATVDNTVSVAVLSSGKGRDSIVIGDIGMVRLSALTINANDDNDTIDASGAVPGSVRVRINGGAGEDTVLGSAFNDVISGGDDDDLISGGGGNDNIRGDAGADTVDAGAGDDTVDGGAADDSITGGNGDDRLLGGQDSDDINGGNGADTILGGFGDDILNGARDDDSILGGSGRDTLLGAHGSDVLDGGRNDDTVRGHSGDDTLRGDHGDDVLDGDGGNDEIVGGDGNDTIMGGDGDDGIAGNDGDDVLRGELGRDTITGNDGDDMVIGGGGADTLLGNQGADSLNGNGGFDTGAVGEGLDDAPRRIELIDESFTLSSRMLESLDGV